MTMSRKSDLEQNIRESYTLIRRYEAIIRTSSDPKEQARSKREIVEQWTLIGDYWSEYSHLAGEDMPPDIAEIGTRFSADGRLQSPALAVPDVSEGEPSTPRRPALERLIDDDRRLVSSAVAESLAAHAVDQRLREEAAARISAEKEKTEGRVAEEEPHLSLLERLRKMPAWVLSVLGVLLLFSVGAGSIGYGLVAGIRATATPTPTAMPSPMPHGFNVAVAEFAELDATGHLTSSQNALDLSNWLRAAIEKETDQLPAALQVNIQGPDEIRIVPGEDRNTRAANAAQVAARHNATILIYGVVVTVGDGHHVEPEFYVPDESFGYGSEVAGPDRLGQKIPFEFPLGEPATLMGVNEKLNARTQALMYLVSGLAYLYVGKYDNAWARFKDARGVRGWQDDEGKEVVHLLMGATKLCFYRQGGNPESLSQALIQATEAFTEAFQLNPNYSRSYLGLGAVALQQATILNPERTRWEGVEGAKLAEAAYWYSKSLSTSDQPTSAHVPAKAAFGLGQAHCVGYLSNLTGWSEDQARLRFSQVISAYEADQSPDLVWYAGHAHANIGRLAHNEEDWPEMASSFRKAIEVLETTRLGRRPHSWIALYWGRVAYAEEQLNRLDATRDAYQRAIENGAEVVGSGARAVSTEDLAEWRAALDRLEKGAP